MPRKRTVTIEHTTTVTATETEDTLPPVAYAPGWETAMPDAEDDPLTAQRADQMARCRYLLWLYAASNKPDPDTMAAVWDAGRAGDLRAAAAMLDAPEQLVRDAVTILRAGPSASPMELLLGRS